MRKTNDGIRGRPPSWVHYMCYACYTVQPGHVEYSASGDILGVYKPEGRFKVPGPGIYSCCICRAFCVNPIWFVQPPDDQPSCRHDPATQSVREFRALYFNRPNPNLEAVPSVAG
jgi:hypothetical protein